MTPLRFGLIGGNAALLAAIIWVVTLGDPAQPQLPPGTRQVEAGNNRLPLAEFARPPALERSLFRPVSSPTLQQPPPPSQSPEPQLRLVGILLGSQKIGLVEQNQSKAQQIRVGDQIDGWIVQSIERRSVILSQGERTATYHLDPPRDS